MKDTGTTESPESGRPPGTDAGTQAPHNPRSELAANPTAIADDTTSGDSAATTEHLRRLWMAGARDITVTYDADTVRHRTYLSHPRTDS